MDVQVTFTREEMAAIIRVLQLKRECGLPSEELNREELLDLEARFQAALLAWPEPGAGNGFRLSDVPKLER